MCLHQHLEYRLLHPMTELVRCFSLQSDLQCQIKDVGCCRLFKSKSQLLYTDALYILSGLQILFVFGSCGLVIYFSEVIYIWPSMRHLWLPWTQSLLRHYSSIELFLLLQKNRFRLSDSLFFHYAFYYAPIPPCFPPQPPPRHSHRVLAK